MEETVPHANGWLTLYYRLPAHLPDFSHLTLRSMEVAAVAPAILAPITPTPATPTPAIPASDAPASAAPATPAATPPDCRLGYVGGSSIKLSFAGS